MSEESLESVLEAARKLPVDEQLRLAEQIAKEVSIEEVSDEYQLMVRQQVQSIIMYRAKSKKRALEAVEKTRGSMKDLDRDTIIWLAEDEELIGY